MIRRFRQITDGLYRGSAPTPHDVEQLHKQLGIRKIVSLDKATGDRIDRICKLLGIQHVKAYIDDSRSSLVKVLSQNLKHLLIDDGPTFLHCHEGKDRTGLITALFKCKYLGENPEQAIKEAKSMGFGVGVPSKVISLFEKLIRACKPAKDINHADIVSNEREYIGDNRDSFLDESRQSSFAPYLDHTRQNPADALYVYVNDQSPTRQNYRQYRSIKEHDQQDTENIPQVGVFNNDAGSLGAGPISNYSGFFYD